MNQVDSDEAQRRAFLHAFLGPEIAGAGEEIAALANFELSKHERAPWTRFIEWMNTRPRFISRWRAEENQPRYHRFSTAIADSRSAFAGAKYHLARLADLEARISDALSARDFSSLPRGTVVATPGANIADFEYHGFVFAYRRSLDYLAWGLATYFDTPCTSFREFGSKVGKWQPKSVAGAIAEVCARHLHHFAFVIADEKGKSTRDRIAHKSFLPAFVVNIRASGFRLVGGGERLGGKDGSDENSLAAILETRIAHLHDAISDLLSTFQQAVISSEPPASEN